MGSNHRNVLELLIEGGKITRDQALEAVREARTANSNPLNILATKRLITENDVIAAVAKSEGVEVVENIYSIEPDSDAIEKLPERVATRYKVLPVRYDAATDTLTLIVPVAQLRSVDLKDSIKLATKVKNVAFMTASVPNIELGITRSYRADVELARIVTESATAEKQKEDSKKSKDDSFEQVIEVAQIPPVVRFVNLVLEQAITDKASDIHIEAEENMVRVRFRIDGVLHDVNSAPKDMGDEIVSRIKIMSELNIAERRIPQDGRMTYMHEKRGKMDLRVAILPTVWGEKIVMRILDNSSASLELQQLGFSDLSLERFRSAYTKPYGMILVTGPTGSGKSTTLYAALNEISNPGINIVTVEDPVEYRIPRINQVPVSPKQGLTFAAALRSILRADPDVILVGEIRDHETAQIAVESGLTGHLVLSTLHTNNAASAVTRLTEMGIEPFLVGSVVEAVLAQRLIRKLCDNCNVTYTPDGEFLKKIGFPWNEDEPLPTLRNPVGCPQCAGTGYRGRTAVHEVLLVDPEVEKLTVAGATSSDIERYAVTQGMRTLKQDGWLRVLEGKTSIEEILRVIA